MKNNKKILNYMLVTFDVLVTLFLFVISIIMLVTMPKTSAELNAATGFIGYLQKNPTVYLFAFVLPLFILLIVNVLYLIFYIKKLNEKNKVKLNDLTAEEKEKLKAELLSDVLSKDQSKKK